MFFLKNLSTNVVTCIMDAKHLAFIVGRRIAPATLRARKGSVVYIRDIPYLYGDTLEDFTTVPHIGIKSHHLQYRVYGSDDKSEWRYLVTTGSKLDIQNLIKISYNQLCWKNLGENHEFYLDGGIDSHYRFYRIEMCLMNSDHDFIVDPQEYAGRVIVKGSLHVREIMDDTVTFVKKVSRFSAIMNVACSDVYRNMRNDRVMRIGERFFQFSDSEEFTIPIINRTSARYMCRVSREGGPWSTWSSMMSVSEIAKTIGISLDRVRDIVHCMTRMSDKYTSITGELSFIIRPYQKYNTINYLISERKGTSHGHQENS